MGGAKLPGKVLVVGFARTGAAVARVLVAHGVAVTAVDDAPSTAGLEEAARLGVELLVTPEPARLRSLADAAELVVVSPGVPPVHPVFASVPGDLLVSEVELASRLGAPPIVAITGTNGKTTVTSLVADMLARSGLRSRAAGNIGYPLVEAVGEPGLDVVVAEVSSFQLALTTTFRPAVGAWLNLAEDHLDWHRDLVDYVEAKARIWANQDSGDVAVANAEDAVVLGKARRSAGRLVTFGLRTGDFHLEGDALTGPHDEVWGRVGDLRRSLPHDVVNALAAIAAATAAGATHDGVLLALREQPALAHRVELVESVAGVGYYDDSKATTPAAVVAALAGFASVVLVAGGRSKGLDLGAIPAALRAGAGAGDADAPGAARPATRLRGVVAIGEAADEVRRAFSADWPVVRASSMGEAVREAAHLAEPGDVVLLSPGCASFDWYSSYEERGEDFVRAVRALGADARGRG